MVGQETLTLDNGLQIVGVLGAVNSSSMLNDMGEIVEIDAVFQCEKTESINKSLEGHKGVIGDYRFRIEKLKFSSFEVAIYLINETKLLK